MLLGRLKKRVWHSWGQRAGRLGAAPSLLGALSASNAKVRAPAPPGKQTAPPVNQKRGKTLGLEGACQGSLGRNSQVPDTTLRTVDPEPSDKPFVLLVAPDSIIFMSVYP